MAAKPGFGAVEGNCDHLPEQKGDNGIVHLFGDQSPEGLAHAGRDWDQWKDGLGLERLGTERVVDTKEHRPRDRQDIRRVPRSQLGPRQAQVAAASTVLTISARAS